MYVYHYFQNGLSKRKKKYALAAVVLVIVSIVSIVSIPQSPTSESSSTLECKEDKGFELLRTQSGRYLKTVKTDKTLLVFVIQTDRKQIESKTEYKIGNR